MMNRPIGKIMAALAASFLLLVAGCSAGGGQQKEVELVHVHGLGYTADGKQLYVAAHDGFRVYANGGWEVPDLPRNDYMGYQATDDGFYSSGHPGPSTGMKNPLGVVKSVDGGKTLSKLGFEGESDFHAMGVGYKNHAIYAVNLSPNSRLSAGVHYSPDDGKTWRKSALQGLSDEPITIAVHPTKASVMAVATQSGLFLSTNNGDTFEQVSREAVTAAAFSPSGDALLFGFQKLSAYDLTSKQVRTLQTPGLGTKDAIGYVAVNPVRAEELVFATFGRDMYQSTDGGKSWRQIALQGKGR